MQVDYDAISQIYDDVRRADVVLINAFAREITLDADTHVLDIGCGTGNHTDLVQRLTGATVYGVEPSAGMRAKAAAKNPALILAQGDAAHIPFDAATFDFAYMTDVIHHVPDLGAMFAEIRRVLKPGGKFCIVTQSHAQVAARPIARFFPGTVRVDQARYPDIPQIIDVAAAHTFTALKNEVLGAGDQVELGPAFLELVCKKGYSMLHLITEDEYAAGLRDLEAQLAGGPIAAAAAGETLVWLSVR